MREFGEALQRACFDLPSISLSSGVPGECRPVVSQLGGKEGEMEKKTNRAHLWRAAALHPSSLTLLASASSAADAIDQQPLAIGRARPSSERVD